MGNNTLLLFLLSVVVVFIVVSILLFCFGIRFWCVHFWQTSWMWPHGQRVLCLLHAWGPIKSKQIIDTYADCLCVCMSMGVWIALHLKCVRFRTVKYAVMEFSAPFAVCLICIVAVNNKASQRETLLYSALFGILSEPLPNPNVSLF